MKCGLKEFKNWKYVWVGANGLRYDFKKYALITNDASVKEMTRFGYLDIPIEARPAKIIVDEWHTFECCKECRIDNCKKQL